MPQLRETRLFTLVRKRQGIYVNIFRYFLNGIQQGQCVISNNADVYRVKVQVLQVDKLYALKAANLWLPFLISSYFLLLVNFFVQSRESFFELKFLPHS